MTEAPRIYATFRYSDPDAMIGWLCDTVGFSLKARYPETGESRMPNLLSDRR